GPSKSRPPMSHRKTDLGIPCRSKSAKVVLGRVLSNAQIAAKCPQRPSSMVYTVKVHLQRTLADLMFPPHCQSRRGRNESAVVLVSLIDDARPRASDLHDHSDDRAYHGDQSSC